MKKDKNKKEKKNEKEVIDLTQFITPGEVKSDVLGSYTGVPDSTYYDGEYEIPVQDADDL